MENILINIIFTIIMLGLAVWDFVSYGKQKHRDFKSIIMSTGVWGLLWGFSWAYKMLMSMRLKNLSHFC